MTRISWLETGRLNCRRQVHHWPWQVAALSHCHWVLRLTSHRLWLSLPLSGVVYNKTKERSKVLKLRHMASSKWSQRQLMTMMDTIRGAWIRQIFTYIYILVGATPGTFSPCPSLWSLALELSLVLALVLPLVLVLALVLTLVLVLALVLCWPWCWCWAWCWNT